MLTSTKTTKLSETLSISDITDKIFKPGDKLPDGRVYFGPSPDTGEELAYSPNNNTFSYFFR